MVSGVGMGPGGSRAIGRLSVDFRMPKGQLQRTLNYFSLYFSSPLHRFRVPFIFYAYFLPFRFFLFIFLFLFLLLMSGRCSFAVFLYSSFYLPSLSTFSKEIKIWVAALFRGFKKKWRKNSLFVHFFFFTQLFRREDGSGKKWWNDSSNNLFFFIQQSVWIGVDSSQAFPLFRQIFNRAFIRLKLKATFIRNSYEKNYGSTTLTVQIVFKIMSILDFTILSTNF